MLEQRHLVFQLYGIDPILGQGLFEQLQHVVNPDEGFLGHQAQIDPIHDLLETHVDHRLDAEGQAQGVEFELVVAAVHGGDVHGEMALFINVFADIVFFFRQDQGLELGQVFKQQIGLFEDARLAQGRLKLVEMGKGLALEVGQVGPHLLAEFRAEDQIVFPVEQLVEAHGQLDPGDVGFGNIARVRDQMSHISLGEVPELIGKADLLPIPDVG